MVNYKENNKVDYLFYLQLIVNQFIVLNWVRLAE
jgi:hypothetical protein